MIHVAANRSEQRAAGRGIPLFEGVLSYNELNATDYAIINTFFNTTVQGQGATWSMTVPKAGVLNNCKFTQDTIKWTENSTGIYSTKLEWRQLNNAGYTIPTPASTFPALANTSFGQFPYTPEFRMLTSVNDQPSGWAYAFKWFGASLSGFPSTNLRRWGLGNPILSDVDAGTIEDYFVGNLGMYGGFDVVDPETAVTHHNVRFGGDTIEIQYLDVNQTAISFLLEETNG